MVGIGPFIPQKDTPFGTETAGTMEMTLRLLSIIRLIHPHVLLPATTALGTIHPKGRGAWNFSGSKCRHAEFIPGCRAGETASNIKTGRSAGSMSILRRRRWRITGS